MTFTCHRVTCLTFAPHPVTVRDVCLSAGTMRDVFCHPVTVRDVCCHPVTVRDLCCHPVQCMTLACHPVTCVLFATHPVTCAWRFCLCSCTWPVSARCATSSRTVTTPAKRCSRQPTCAATRAWRGGGIPLAYRIETSLPGGTALDTRSWLWPTCWKRLAVPSASGVSVNSVADPQQTISHRFILCLFTATGPEQQITPPPPPPPPQ